MAFEKGMPVLFILMRTDLASMNPGKAIAQGSHAANQAAYMAQGGELLSEWQEQTNMGFGTVIVLDGGSYAIIDRVLIEIQTEMLFHTNEFDDALYQWVHDPSYPLRDGDFTHSIPLNTCAYVFCRVGSIAHKKLEGFELHP